MRIFNNWEFPNEADTFFGGSKWIAGDNSRELTQSQGFFFTKYSVAIELNWTLFRNAEIKIWESKRFTAPNQKWKPKEKSKQMDSPLCHVSQPYTAARWSFRLPIWGIGSRNWRVIRFSYQWKGDKMTNNQWTVKQFKQYTTYSIYQTV